MPSSRPNKHRLENDADPPEPGKPMPSQTVRQVASLALCIHLFCIFAVMTANIERSPLQTRIVEVLRPYTRVFNFELDYVPYYLTHATEFDVDHQIEILPKNGDPDSREDWMSISEGRWRGGEPYRRFQQFGKVLDFYAAQQGSDEAPSGFVAKGVAECFLHQRKIEPSRIRCRRHVLQNRDVIIAGTPSQQDPWDETTYFRTPYEANLLVDQAGYVTVAKIDPEGQVAQPDGPQSGAP